MAVKDSVNLQPAVFLDRDGVLIENRPAYVRSWEDVVFIERSVTAARLISDAGFPIVVVSNQAGIGRKVVEFDVARALFDRILNHYRANGANILAGYMCPHRPEDNCECRKPKPGMLLQASREFKLDLHRSVMVGDALRDLEAAEAVDMKGKLVRTGMGSDQEKGALSSGGSRWPVFADLLDAVPSILSDLQETE